MIFFISYIHNEGNHLITKSLVWRLKSSGRKNFGLVFGVGEVALDLEVIFGVVGMPRETP